MPGEFKVHVRSLMKATSNGTDVCVCKRVRVGGRGRSLGQWDSLSKEALTRNSTWLLGNSIALLHIGAMGRGGVYLQHVCLRV